MKKTNGITMAGRLVGLLALLVIAACASPGGGEGYVTPTMSNEAFINASVDERSAYAQAVVEEAKLVEQKQTAEFYAGRPVAYGSPDTGVTLHWVKPMGMIMIYPGHQTGAASMQMQAMLGFKADKDGRIEYQRTAQGWQPVVLIRSASTMESDVRHWSKVLGSIAASSVSNLGASVANNLLRCKSDCPGGQQFFIQGGQALSQAAAESNVDISSQVYGDTTGGPVIELPPIGMMPGGKG